MELVYEPIGTRVVFGNAPTSLDALGVKETDLDRAAEISTENLYYNPRPVTREGVRTLLDDAFHGHRPQT